MKNKVNSMSDTCSLSDGNNIPWVGFGTYLLKAEDNVTKIVELALRQGYRHIDTAAIYGNEREVGQAIKNSKIPRDQIFVTTKLWNDDHNDVQAACNLSLKKLGLDYLDLYLIHWPVKERLASWAEMVKLQQQKKVKSIGVSNFTISHLQELFQASTVKPVINQVEFSPFLYQQELLQFCESNKIILQAYSPLVKSLKMDNQTLVQLAQKYNKTVAQLILRWILDLGVIVLPKTATPERVVENINLFDFSLSADDSAKIAKLHTGFRTSWDPTNVP